MEESQVGIHHIVGSHIDGDGAAGRLGQSGCLGNEFLVLDQIAFNVEIIVPFEEGGLQVFRAQFQGGAHIVCESSLRIGSGDEYHAPAAGLGPIKHLGTYSVLLHSAFEQVSEVVVSYFSQEAGFHSEDGGTGDGVGCTAAGDVFDAVLLEGFPDAVSGFHIHVLHTAEGQVEGPQEGVVRKDGQDVGEGVADTKDGFHNGVV